MTTSIAPPRPTTLSGRGSHASRRRPQAQIQLNGPCCSLKAQPAPHATPAPSWEELLGQR